ncbi:hypothetical protein F0M18_17685 [Pseudohalioglobus sediminis]|uniref:Type 4 fimbrial biogenesis protein PilX N-terminal domain-containing protein n=1 Tax=Pseudohalioglobus sediminis TaxID=2606449 RepID=A0A5B0WMP6_9GAMM|nr:hypothetical protein [Pseudohalioglobus sediminis]KAA1188334.1 hypothetical protein F0M18_17685 [Pseudohalioglobus sediminis]
MTVPHRQHQCRGVITLFIAGIMLLLTSLMVVSGVRISATSLAAVGNVQVRAGAVDAADKVLAGLITGDYPLAGVTAAHVEQVDLNRDGVSDYEVVVEPPTCLRATPVSRWLANSVTLTGFAADSEWQTVWELTATATDVVTGASISLSQGVSYVLSTAQRSALCAEHLTTP